MTGLREDQLAAVLESVGAATPAPGGGSSAAVTCALAAALVEMSAGLTGNADARDHARALRERTLTLADDELTSYAPVLEARRLPADDPERATRIETALETASRTPLAIAEAAAETAVLAAEVARPAGAEVRGDAVTGALLAEAATVAAAVLVEINLSDAPEDVALAHAEELRQRAAGARASALALNQSAT